MSAFAGQALSWRAVGPALEVELHRAPCNEIGTTTLRELENLTAYLSDGAGGARAVILHSSLSSGFCAGADLRELHAGLKERADDRVQAIRTLVPAGLPAGARRLCRTPTSRGRTWSRYRAESEPIFRRLDRPPPSTFLQRWYQLWQLSDAPVRFLDSREGNW